MRPHRTCQLLPLLLLVVLSTPAAGQQPPGGGGGREAEYLRNTYAGAVTTPRMKSAMDTFMNKPIDAIRYSQPAYTLGMLHSTEELRQWLYAQTLAVSQMADNSFTMFYAGTEDGRFVGCGRSAFFSSCPPSPHFSSPSLLSLVTRGLCHARAG